MSTLGQMAEDMMGNGKKIICMVMEFILGPMVEGMKEIMKMIKRMARVHTNGPMVDST